MSENAEARAREAELREELSRALAGTKRRLLLARPLRLRFEESRSTARAAELRRLGLLGPANYLIIVLTAYFFLVGAPSFWAMAIELVAVPGFVLTMAHRYYRDNAPFFRREMAALAVCVVVTAGMIVVFASGPAGSVALNLMFASCVVGGTIVVTRQPMPFTLAYAALATLLLVGAAAMRPDAPLEGRVYSIAILVTTAVMLVIGLWQLERARVEQFLRDLAKTLDMEDLASAVRALDDLSSRDPLTGAGNRRLFERRLAEARASAGHHALLLIDVDHFKDFNDRFGHQAGDQCLRRIVSMINGHLGPLDCLARIGGDEFAVLVFDASEAASLADRLCALATQASPGEDGAHVTLTIGGAHWRAHLDPERLLANADTALYAAKRAGRACARWADEATRDLANKRNAA